MRILWRQTTWVVLVSTTTNTPSFTKIGHCIHAKVYLFVEMLTRNLHCLILSIHTYISIQTTWQWKSKWSFQRSWWPTKRGFFLASFIIGVTSFEMSETMGGTIQLPLAQKFDWKQYNENVHTMCRIRSNTHSCPYKRPSTSFSV